MSNARPKNPNSNEESHSVTASRSEGGRIESLPPLVLERTHNSERIGFAANRDNQNFQILPRSNFPTGSNFSSKNMNSNTGGKYANPPNYNSGKNLEDLFGQLQVKLKTKESDILTNEKIKISRAINFIFKNNLKEIAVKGSINLKKSANSSIVESRNNPSELNVNFYKKSKKLNSAVSSSESTKSESNLFQVNMNKIQSSGSNFVSDYSSVPASTAPGSPGRESRDGRERKKRDQEEKLLHFIPDVIRKIKSEESLKENKIVNVNVNNGNIKNNTGNNAANMGNSVNNSQNTSKNPEVTINERLEISKRLLSNNINNFKDLNNLNIGNNINSNIPITVNPYPPADSQLKNFHLNMNITNININSNKNPVGKKAAAKPVFKCVRDEKLINEVKECLRKKGIVFNEIHHPQNYTFKFIINDEAGPFLTTPHTPSYKSYEITVDIETSKIMNYHKMKGEKTIVVINNAEESAGNLIIDELSTLKKDLEKFTPISKA